MGSTDDIGTDPIARAYHYLTGRDVEVALDAAAATIGARRVSSEQHRLHHRPGHSVTRVDLATLTSDSSSHPTPEGAPGSGDAILVAHAHRHPVPEPVERLEVAGAQFAVWAYPNDPYLPGLRFAMDPNWVGSQLRGAGQTADGLTLVRRAYRPTRGAVVEARVEAASGSRAIAFLKVLRPGRLDAVVRVHDLLGGSLPVPRVLSHTDDVAILATMPGTPLRRALRRHHPLPPPDDLVTLSIRLAASHATTGQDPRRRADPAAHVHRLRRRVPDLATSFDTIVGASSPGDAPLVTVHGDLHGGQLLTTSGKITGLLDLDGVGRGRLADDAANLVVHLAAQGDQRPAAAPGAERYAAAVLEGYGRMVDPGVLPSALAGAWLSLATVADRAGDETLLRERVDRALRALDGGTGVVLPDGAAP